MAPAQLVSQDSPCFAAALYPDGTVRVSGLHCTKATRTGVWAGDETSTVRALVATTFGSECDAGLLPDAGTILGLVGHFDPSLITSTPQAGERYADPWPCPHAPPGGE